MTPLFFFLRPYFLHLMDGPTLKQLGSMSLFSSSHAHLQKQQLEPSKHLVQNQIQSDFFCFFSGGPGWTTFDCSHFSHLQPDACFCLPKAQLLAVSQT